MSNVHNIPLTRDALAALDAADPLAGLRDQFYLPDGVLYFDGNSLGALPRATPERLAEVIHEEWGERLIRSWNISGWYEMPRRVGDKIGQLIGAGPDQVVVADSTSVNLFKVLAAALHLNPTRRVIVSERENFPTDLYMAQGLIDLLGAGHELRLTDAAGVANAIDEQTAVVLLTHANYRTGALHDMRALTTLAHARGALIIWDLAHSAGALPVELDSAGADFAVGCGYKFLNGGPGAPAFVYVAARHQANFSQPLSGWLGHAQPFAFDWKYEPAQGIGRYLAGTQPILSMSALECGIDLMLRADMQQVRAKSLALTDLFIRMVDERCPVYGLELITPREPERRSSQVCWRFPNAYPVMQACIARGLIGDFRPPDILRFGVAPLYLRYTDVWEAADILADVLNTGDWKRPEFQQKAAVT